MKLNRRDLVRIFARSFMIQGLWTIQRGQNLGYVYSLWPALRRFHSRRDDRARAARAHAGYFSTHPYTAGVLLGVVAGMEEDRSEGDGTSVENVLAARSAMSGPLAALGEAFFWGTWLPFCLAATLAMGAIGPSAAIWSPVLFLIFFNSLHLGVRAAGLWLGYRWKKDVVGHLAPFRIQGLLPLLALGAMALVVLRGALAPPAGFSAVQGLLWTGVFWGTLRLGVRPSFLALGIAAASVAYAGIGAFL